MTRARPPPVLREPQKGLGLLHSYLGTEMSKKLLIVTILFAALFGSTVVAQENSSIPPNGAITNGRTTFTSFEFFNQNGSDATPIQVGDVTFSNVNAAVGAAATRGVPAGYRSGCFVWLTAFGQSKLVVNRQGRNSMQFWIKNITEAVPNTAGTLLVRYQDGSTQSIQVRNGPKNRFNKVILRNVARIDIITNGITNIDDFRYTQLP